MSFLKVAWSDISGIAKNRIIRASVVGIIVVPLLYALFYLYAFWDPYSRLDKLPVAVVNLDKGGTKDGVTVNKGNDLVNLLKKNDQLKWEFTDAKDADDGLKGNKYYARYVIPEDFTQKLLSGQQANPQQPDIVFSSNEKRNFLATQINESKVVATLEELLSKNLAGEYSKVAFDNLYKLKDGLGKAADGSGQIKDGIGTLNSFVPTLKSGASQLYDGANTINTNLSTAKNGAASLNSGLGQLNGQLPDFITGVSGLYKGSSDLVNGINQLKPGANQLAAGLQEASTKVPQLTDGANTLKISTQQVSDGVTTLINGVSQSQAALQNAADTNLAAFLQSNPTAMGDANMQKFLGTLNALKTASADPTYVAQMKNLKDGAAQTAVGAAQLSGGVNQLASQLGSAVTGSKQISDGMNQVASGATQLNAGLGQLNQKAPQLSTGVSSLYSGSSSLANGLGQLYTGSTTLKDSLGALKGQIPVLVDGASKLAAGSTQLNSQLKDASTQLNSGLTTNSDTMSKFISDGVKVKHSRVNPVNNYGTGFSPYFLSLSLYVGSMLMFFVITSKVDPKIKAGKVSIVIGKFFSYGYIGCIQAVLAALVVLVLGLHPNNVLLYFFFLIFMSYVFIALNQCLVFLLGEVGRMLAIVLLILQLTSCGGTFPNDLVPKFFNVMEPFMPFTYTISGLREVISGTNYGTLGMDFLVLLGMMVIFMVVSILFKDRAERMQAEIEEQKKAYGTTI